MKIQKKKYKVKEVVKGFIDDENGCFALNGKLNIRPIYQREFIYDNKKQSAVIETVINGFPLNIIYWVKQNDGHFSVLDGQQRTISIANYIKGEFSVIVDDHPMYFHSLSKEIQNKILDYVLDIYVCVGSDSMVLKWFEVINIAGVSLTKQEMRNAIYSGPGVVAAKKYFSKPNHARVDTHGAMYVKGVKNRQDFLEVAYSWISKSQGITIEDYMSLHKNDTDAEELWSYWEKIINWIKKNFITYHKKEMQQVPWNDLYIKYKDKQLDPYAIDSEINEMMGDEEIKKKSGIYSYVLDRKEKHLNLRVFNDSQKRSAYTKQEGICKICETWFPIDKMDADHIIPWSKGGKTLDNNIQMLCKQCNKEKSNK